MTSIIERRTGAGSGIAEPDNLDDETLALLEAIQWRVLWLSTNIIDHANHVRQNADKSKVGGHQASSASVVSILTALYFHHLNGRDRVCDQTTRLASLPCRAIPPRSPRPLLSHDLAWFSRTTVLPQSHQGSRPGRFLHGSVGLGAVAPAFRRAHRALCLDPLRDQSAPALHRARRRRGTRRGQCLGSRGRGSGARSGQCPVDCGPQPPEPRPDRARHSRGATGATVRREWLARIGSEIWRGACRRRSRGRVARRSASALTT